MNTAKFQPFCCICNVNIDLLTDKGLILSCGDFLCDNCSEINSNSNKCPSCNKNIRGLRIQEPLPDQVTQNIADISSCIDNLQKALTFQIRHYKIRLKKVGEEINQYKQDNNMLKEQLKAYQTSSNRSIDSINFFSDDISNDLPNGNSNYGVRPDTAQSDNRSIRSSLTQAVIGGQYDRYPQNISNEGFKRNISQISIDSNTSNSMKPVVDRDSISRENYNSIRQPVKQLSDTRNVIAQSPSINQWLNESPRNNNAAVLSNQTTSNSKAIIETDVLRQLQNTSRNAIPNQLSSSITNQNLSQPQMNRTTRLPSPSNPQTFHHQSGGLNSPSNPRSPMMSSQSSFMRPSSNPSPSRIRSPYNAVLKPPLREMMPFTRLNQNSSIKSSNSGPTSKFIQNG